VADSIDLVQDENSDGIPDALASEVENIRALGEAVQAASAEDDQQAAQVALASAITSFSERLPYSEQTRALQQRANEISIQLGNTDNPTLSALLLAELEQIERQKMSDPNYAEVMIALTTLLGLPRESVSIDQMLVQRMYLPIVSLDNTGDAQLAAASVSAAPNFGVLSRHHIMFINSASKTNFAYAMTYSHVGVYDGSNLVYESNQDGVKLRALKEWQTKGKYVGLARNNRTSMVQNNNALNWAKTKWKTNGETAYNTWFIDKNTDSKLYCSQLVWKIQKYNNVDVDSNHWTYMLWMSARYWLLFGVGVPVAVTMMVAPDEIALDGDITIYSTGKN